MAMAECAQSNKQMSQNFKSFMKSEAIAIAMAIVNKSKSVTKPKQRTKGKGPKAHPLKSVTNPKPSPVLSNRSRIQKGIANFHGLNHVTPSGVVIRYYYYATSTIVAPLTGLEKQRWRWLNVRKANSKWPRISNRSHPQKLSPIAIAGNYNRLRNSKPIANGQRQMAQNFQSFTSTKAIANSHSHSLTNFNLNRKSKPRLHFAKKLRSNANVGCDLFLWQ